MNFDDIPREEILKYTCDPFIIENEVELPSVHHDSTYEVDALRFDSKTHTWTVSNKEIAGRQ